MLPRVVKFRGDFEPFSMFHEGHPFKMYGIQFPTGEHALHWHKTENETERQIILGASTPREAKRLGRKVSLVAGWNDKRAELAYQINLAKFSQHADLEDLLLSVDGDIIEGNTWHDNTWGSCVCGQPGCGNGRNILGVSIVRVRQALWNRRR